MAKWHSSVWLLATLLALVTVGLYWPATSNDFVNLDDPVYVTANVHVRGGPTLKNLEWACTHQVCCNWHPVTVLTHMLDCQMFGLKPWGHHLTSVLLHALNAGLLFLLLHLMTGAKWRSLAVAALFAFHPVHVESVAWVAERKDVLSGFFGLLALIAYVRYVQDQRPRTKDQGPDEEKAEGRMQNAETSVTHHASRITHHASRSTLHALRFYALSLLFFALGLMSKPMLVTWPFVLLLLDYWPLRRNAEGRMQNAEIPIRHHASRITHHAPRSTLHALRSPLLLEKLPFFLLAALASVVTLVVQRGAMPRIESLSLGARLANALISYCRYVGKLFWPTDLAVWYPHPGHWPLGEVLLAGAALTGLSVLLWVKRQRFPYLLVGWLWFLGTLVPVIGLVQVGAQAMADRYTYLPSIGVLVMVVWGVCGGKTEKLKAETLKSEAGQIAPGVSAFQHFSISAFLFWSACLVCCAGVTRQQLGYWRNSKTLFDHALAVTTGNWLAHINLGIALHKQGQIDEALRHFREAIRLRPRSADAHSNLGAALDEQGQVDEAITHLQTALQLDPAHADAHYNLANALAKKGQTDEAIHQLHEALRLEPDRVGAHNNLGLALATKGQTDEAIQQFQEALRLDPGHAEAHLNLGNAFAAKDQIPEAIAQFQETLRLKPDYAQAHFNLGVVLAQQGRTDDAISQFQEALRLKPDMAAARNNLAYLLAKSPEALGALAQSLDGQGHYADAIRFYRDALKAQPTQESVLNNLAWLLASCPDAKFRNGPEAVRLATRACELTEYKKPLLIGTLAAAQAEASDFQAAIATAQRAEALATNLGLKEVAAKNRELIRLYQQGKPFHER